MEFLHLFSIVLEFVIACIAIASVLRGKKYMCGFAVTFLLYVVYDIAKTYPQGGVFDAILPILFFVATVSAFFSVWKIYRQS